MEHCPDWAKEIWYDNDYLKISKLFPILNIKEVRDNYDCVSSAIVNLECLLKDLGLAGEQKDKCCRCGSYNTTHKELEDEDNEKDEPYICHECGYRT